MVRALQDSHRNPLPLPPIQHEELFTKPLSWKRCYPGWEGTVCSSCRLNMQHTLASIRWNHQMRGPLRPNHSLDLALIAIYQHGPEDFPEKSDVVRQPETIGLPTWRLLRNKRHDPGMVPHVMPKLGGGATPRTAPQESSRQGLHGTVKGYQAPRSADPSHPLRLGGLTERRNPFNVKLGIGSHHSPQSNNGFSRNSYGAFYTA